MCWGPTPQHTSLHLTLHCPYLSPHLSSPPPRSQHTSPLTPYTLPHFYTHSTFFLTSLHTPTHFPKLSSIPPYLSPHPCSPTPHPNTLPHSSHTFFHTSPTSFLTSPHTLHTNPIYFPAPPPHFCAPVLTPSSPTFSMFEKVVKLPCDDVTFINSCRSFCGKVSGNHIYTARHIIWCEF